MITARLGDRGNAAGTAAIHDEGAGELDSACGSARAVGSHVVGTALGRECGACCAYAENGRQTSAITEDLMGCLGGAGVGRPHPEAAVRVDGCSVG